METFYEEFGEEWKELGFIQEEREELLRGVCENGKYENGEVVRELRLSRVVGEKEGVYYWSSPEGMMVYSGMKEVECVVPEEYVALGE